MSSEMPHIRVEKSFGDDEKTHLFDIRPTQARQFGVFTNTGWHDHHITEVDGKLIVFERKPGGDDNFTYAGSLDEDSPVTLASFMINGEEVRLHVSMVPKASAPDGSE